MTYATKIIPLLPRDERGVYVNPEYIWSADLTRPKPRIEVVEQVHEVPMCDRLVQLAWPE